jgi:hypothetical protein
MQPGFRASKLALGVNYIPVANAAGPLSRHELPAETLNRQEAILRQIPGVIRESLRRAGGDAFHMLCYNFRRSMIRSLRDY